MITDAPKHIIFSLFFICCGLAGSAVAQARLAPLDDLIAYQSQVSSGAILNVKDPPFLAKGDGITDDTEAIQAAIDAATDPSNPIAKIVLVPDGWYVISRTLLVKNTRHFRLVGAGPGNTAFRWKGNAQENPVAPAIEVLNAAYSEFSNFNIGTEPADNFLKTAILVESAPHKKYVSTGNVFRNLWIDSAQGIDTAIQIGGVGSFYKQNDNHMFLNCSVTGYRSAAVAINSHKATDLFFYNFVALAAMVPHGVVSTGGSWYWINGGVNGVSEYGFDITDPSGPITINLTNEEMVIGFVKAVASGGRRLDLTIANNRFAANTANIPDPTRPFVDIRSSGDVRINKNHFSSCCDPDFRRVFVFDRSDAREGDIYEYQYNRFLTGNPNQPLTLSTLFSGAVPSQLHENHYQVSNDLLPITEWTVGQYPTIRAYDPPGRGDREVLESHFNRMRRLSDSQFLFASHARNSPGIANVRDYGAKGDGTTDDTAAFERALTALMARPNNEGYGFGMLLIPTGDYPISRTLAVRKSHGFRIVGEGSRRSRLIWTGSAGSGNPTVAMDLDGVFLGEVRGVGLALAAGASADIGIRIQTQSFISTRDSLFDVEVNGEAGDLKTAIKVGDGLDANNDFHVFQQVVVGGYTDYGFNVANTQIFNLVFLDCQANGFAPGSAKASQVGIHLAAGTLSWFGGGGRNHTVADMNLATHGNAPVIVSGASFEGSARLLTNGGPNQVLVFMQLDGVKYRSAGSDNRFIELFNPGIHLIENSRFEINAGQTLFSFGDYSRFFPEENRVAIKSLEGFDFIGNEVVSATADWNTFFSGRPPTYERDNVVSRP